MAAYVKLRPTDGAATAWVTPDTVHVGYAFPGILSAGIFAFTLSWNEFTCALVFPRG